MYRQKDTNTEYLKNWQHRTPPSEERALLLSESASGATFDWPLTTHLSDPWVVVSVEPLPANPPPAGSAKRFQWMG